MERAQSPDDIRRVKTNHFSILKTGLQYGKRLVIVIVPERGHDNMFIADIKIPFDAALKPNQTAVVKIQDYAAANAVVIPVNTVQTDDNGKYVYVSQKLSNGKTVASKRNIVIGEVYGDLVEIKTGLKAGEQLITEGYQSLYEGQLIGTN